MIKNKRALIKGSSITCQARKTVLDLLDVALFAIDPRRLVNRALKFRNNKLRLYDHQVNLEEVDGIYVIGAGKATGRMAEAIENLLKTNIHDGLIIVPKNNLNEFSLDRIRLRRGGHPLPTKASVNATKDLLQLIDASAEKALILCLISGGGSTLLSLPPPPLSINDLQETNSLLIRSGASIEAINTVRKHLSQIKGGRLATKIHPRHLWTLLISDVPGDRLDLVASGPTLPDPSTFQDAAQVLDEFRLRDQVPKRVHQRIEAGLAGDIDDTLKPTHPAFQHVVNHLIGSNRDACEAVLVAAKRLGINAKILTTACQGEAREVGAKIGQLAQQLHKEVKDSDVLRIIGSETTVTVRYQGKGGRNSELIAAAMQFLIDHEGLVIASLATDGIDGPTEFAGAIADGTSFRQAQTLKCPPKDALATNTTYNLFQVLNDHILTGPTGSNVRDITLILATKNNPGYHSI